jgi:cytochrome d ubiquinol oxidase subunit I
MRTSDSMSPIGAPGVAISFACFIVAYSIVFGAGIWFILAMMRRPPERHEPGPPPNIPSHAAGITPGPAGAVPAGAGAVGPVLAE